MAQPPVFQSRDAADPAFWDERFSREHTPWDAAGVPAAFRQFCEAQPAPLSTLIPGCGNAYEAGWLADRGWPVTAIDFAPGAVASAKTVLGPHADVVEFGGNPLLPDSGVWRWLLGTAMRGDVPEVCFAVPGGCRWLPWWTLTNAKKSSDLPPGLAETLMLGGAGKPVAEVR